MRLSSVVFPAPRKPVRTVIGTALPLSDRMSIVYARSLFYELSEIDVHHLRHLAEIDQLRVWQLGERLTINVGWIVFMRINFEIACQLLLLLLTRQPGLRHDAHTRSNRQRVAEQEGGFRQRLA